MRGRRNAAYFRPYRRTIDRFSGAGALGGVCAVCPTPLAQAEKPRQARPKKAATDRKGPADDKRFVARLTNKSMDASLFMAADPVFGSRLKKRSQRFFRPACHRCDAVKIPTAYFVITPSFTLTAIGHHKAYPQTYPQKLWIVEKWPHSLL
jgi:hypothetical protein